MLRQDKKIKSKQLTQQLYVPFMLALALTLFCVPAFALTPQEAEDIYRANQCSMVSQVTDQICFECAPFELPDGQCVSPLNLDITVHWKPEWDLPVVDPGDPLIHEEVNGIITIDAPQYFVNSGWESDGVSLSTPDLGNNIAGIGGPFLEYKINPLHNGIYYVWIIGEFVSASSDSFHYGLDGAFVNSITLLNKPISNDLQNGGKATVSPGEGEHILNIWQREDGSKFSKIILTQDEAYIPGG